MITRFSGLLTSLLLLAPLPGLAQSPEPRPKILTPAGDPIKHAVLVGKITIDGMNFQLEIEGAEGMWMQMGHPPVWGSHMPAADERYHVEFILTDPKSKTRIPYADVVFTAINREIGRNMTLTLAPMWGSAGCIILPTAPCSATEPTVPPSRSAYRTSNGS